MSSVDVPVPVGGTVRLLHHFTPLIYHSVLGTRASLGPFSFLFLLPFRITPAWPVTASIRNLSLGKDLYTPRRNMALTSATIPPGWSPAASCQNISDIWIWTDTNFGMGILGPPDQSSSCNPPDFTPTLGQLYTAEKCPDGFTPACTTNYYSNSWSTLCCPTGDFSKVLTPATTSPSGPGQRPAPHQSLLTKRLAQ